MEKQRSLSGSMTSAVRAAAPRPAGAWCFPLRDPSLSSRNHEKRGTFDMLSGPPMALCASARRQ